MTRDNSAPIFIGGMFKSGTSLLRAMLGRHSKIASGLETYWFELEWNNQKHDATIERLRIIQELYEIDDNSFTKIISNSHSSEEFLSNLLDMWLLKQDKNRWAEKTPGNICQLERIYDYWSDASVIHIIRDPRDILASLYEAKKWNSVDMFMERWSQVFKSLKKFKEQGVLKNKKYLELRYEDLVINPAESLKATCKFLSINFEDSMANFDGEKEDFDKVKNVTGKSSTTLARLAKPLMKSRVGIWQKKLTDQDLIELRNFAGREGLEEMFEMAYYR
jgi:hypothetical protein